MEKDPRILQLLSMLDLKRRGWMVVDHWDADLCAVGVADQSRPRHLVYISVFKQTAGEYYFECEIPVGQDETDQSVVAKGQVDSFSKLLTVLERHLGQ